MMRWLFGRKVTPEQRDGVRGYLERTSRILARHSAAADRWDALVQAAIDAAPDVPIFADPSEELLAGARAIREEAVELYSVALAVAVPALAANAHESFVGMFDEWKAWAGATLRVLEADQVDEAQLREMLALQETNAAATMSHAYATQRLSKGVGISSAEVERIMLEALEHPR